MAREREINVDEAERLLEALTDAVQEVLLVRQSITLNRQCSAGRALDRMLVKAQENERASYLAARNAIMYGKAIPKHQEGSS